MIKVAVYARFGNKEQLELTEQEQREEMQRMAEKEGYLIAQKKAWLLVRSSIPMSDEEKQIKFNELKLFAKDKGYVVVGETFVEGLGTDVYQVVQNLFLGDKPRNDANLLLVRTAQDLGRDTSLLLKMRENLLKKCVRLQSIDGIEEVLYSQDEKQHMRNELLLNVTKDDEEETLTEQTFGGMQ